jgi:ribonucleoside-diphosphate reductase alpha chain
LTLSDKANEIVTKRYYMDDESQWGQLAGRVGFGVGGKEYGETFTEVINNMLFIPGGRILRNVGRNRGSLFNCYCLPIGDSREEIGELFKNALILWGEGGGIGINFSTLRPQGAQIMGVGGSSSGLVSFMQAVDGIAATVESGGQRRAASLGLCDVSHPEIERFIDAKRKEGSISYFNISVGITEGFIESVRNNVPWTLHFNQIPSATVDSQDLWRRIIEGMHRNGEPGLINMTNLRRNNSWYFAPIVGTNPCGEACLEEYGVCDLGSLVLNKFVSNHRFQWSKLESTARLAVRFLDNCIDLNKYTLTPVKQNAMRGRRVGVGVMGVSDMFFAMKMRYGSQQSIDFMERVTKFIRNTCYDESIKLATEKGAFPAFSSSEYCKSHFVKSLPPSVRQSIRKNGIRNVTTMAMAPTGTISLLAEVTSGIEPLMYKAYKRVDRISERTYVHDLYETAKDEDWYVDSTDLTPEDHINMQIAVQKYTDGAVSKTILVPNSYDVSDLSDVLLESMDDLKGVTVYREGSREGQIITPLSGRSVDKALSRQDLDRAKAEEDVSCAMGTCEM